MFAMGGPPPWRPKGKGEYPPPWRPKGKGWSSGGKNLGTHGKGKAWENGKSWGDGCDIWGADGAKDWAYDGDVGSKGWDGGKGWDDFGGWYECGSVGGHGWDVGKAWDDGGDDSGKGWLPADVAAGKGQAPAAACLGTAAGLCHAPDQCHAPDKGCAVPGPGTAAAAAGQAIAEGPVTGSLGLGLSIDGQMNEAETIAYNHEMQQPYIKTHPQSKETRYCSLCEKWAMPTHILCRSHKVEAAEVGHLPDRWKDAPWETEEKMRKKALEGASAAAADPQMQRLEADLLQQQAEHQREQEQLLLQQQAEERRLATEEAQRARRLQAMVERQQAAAAGNGGAAVCPQTPIPPGSTSVTQDQLVDVCNDVVDLVVGIEFKVNGLINSLTQQNIVHHTVNRGVEAREDRSRSPRLRTIEYARQVTRMLSQQQFLNNQAADAQVHAAALAADAQRQHEAIRQQQLANAAAAAFGKAKSPPSVPPVPPPSGGTMIQPD